MKDKYITTEAEMKDAETRMSYHQRELTRSRTEGYGEAVLKTNRDGSVLTKTVIDKMISNPEKQKESYIPGVTQEELDRYRQVNLENDFDVPSDVMKGEFDIGYTIQKDGKSWMLIEIKTFRGNCHVLYDVEQYYLLPHEGASVEVIRDRVHLHYSNKQFYREADIHNYMEESDRPRIRGLIEDGRVLFYKTHDESKYQRLNINILSLEATLDKQKSYLELDNPNQEEIDRVKSDEDDLIILRSELERIRLGIISDIKITMEDKPQK